MDQGTEGRRPRKVSDIYRGRVRQDGPIIVQTGKLTLATGELQIESEEDRLKNRVDDEEDEEDEGRGEFPSQPGTSRRPDRLEGRRCPVPRFSSRDDLPVRPGLTDPPRWSSS